MSFQRYLRIGEVRAVSKDPALVRSLLLSAKQRKETVGMIPLNEKTAASIFDSPTTV